MPRSFSATSLVTLPLLSSSSAVALGDRLLAAARRRPSLPATLAASRLRLEGAHGELRKARVYMGEAPAAAPNAAAEADLWVDTAWGAFHGVLKGWARLPARGGPGEAQSARAGVLLRGLFSDGLRFLKLPHDQEWAETQRRLDRVDEPDFAAHVEALGAEPFVDAIKRAFEAYGEALRAGKARAEAPAKVREPLARFVAALRSYALNVTTYGDLGGEGSSDQALADELLAPLARWQSPGGTRKAKAEPGDAGDAGGDSAGSDGAGDGDAGDDGGAGDAGDAGDDDGAGDADDDDAGDEGTESDDGDAGDAGNVSGGGAGDGAGEEDGAGDDVAVAGGVSEGGAGSRRAV
ncbi:MAG TPA: hypothetical protein VFS43_15895 [Polyangiaceae bacterium]|nr:hypothetical protein [Polyangiaceae bacterium]